MEFIDHTGHIFSLPSYKSYPTGYEYDLNDYIFWVDCEYGCKLSTNNVYIKPIRILFKNSGVQVTDITVTLESNVFKLLGSNTVAENIKLLSNYNEYISLNEDKDFLNKLEYEDFDDLINTDEGNIYTFYLVAYTSEIGTWNSTGLISIKYKDEEEVEPESFLYCPFSVGGQFFDESEELVINGRNMGVYLPKDILKAIYQVPFNNEYQDTVLYNDKLKEYLLNYIGIKAECGNYNSILKSVDWFGYGDKITISKLLRTDNELMYQYIHDYFNIDDDVIDSFKTFVTSTYISLGINENIETDESYPQDFSSDFYGEGNPILENLFEKDIIEHYDEGDIDFYRPYYRYCFNELGMKLSAMKYYLEKYFMPIYLSIHSASIKHKAYTNDVKYLINTHNVINEKITFINTGHKAKVIFPEQHTLYISNKPHYIDNKYNEFNNTYENAVNNLEDAYYLHTSIIEVPLRFEFLQEDNTYNTDGYYDVIIQLIKGTECIFSEHTQFIQNDNILYNNFIIYPRNLSRNKNYKLSDWINDNYQLCVNVNGTWYYYNFTIKMPKLDIHLGTLRYKYDKSFEQGEYGQFNMFMWHPELVEDNNIKFIEEQLTLWTGRTDSRPIRTDKQFIDFLNMYKESMHFTNNKKYYNRVLIFDLYKIGADGKKSIVDYNENQSTEYIQSLYNDIKDFVLDEKYVLSYDTYLMHDDNIWYIVCISKNTIDIVDDEYLTPSKDSYKHNTNYLLVYNRGVNRILVNRLSIDWSEGNHHFDNTDIIICTLSNNEPLSVDLETQSKWSVERMTIGMTANTNVKSIGNIGIISVGNKNDKYETGYYSISVNYNIDGTTNHTENRQLKFFVK